MTSAVSEVAIGPSAPRFRLRLTPRVVIRLVAAFLLLAIAVAGLLSHQIAPYGTNDIDLTNMRESPHWFGAHILGTDDLGRDLFSRILYGVRSSVIVGIVAVAISAVIGVTFGLLAGYVGGFTGQLIMRLVDVQLSVPPIVLVIFLAFLIGPGLTTTCIILGLVGWLPYARLVRAELLVVKEQQFMLAAKAIGCSPLRTMVRHALPQVSSSVIVLSTLQLGAAVILEASVSYLGFGIQPPDSSLGLLISEGRVHLNNAWWLAFGPAAFLFVIVLLTNFLGDELQEILDPVKRRAAQ
jgi:peptide/nickel transport system permease protein